MCASVHGHAATAEVLLQAGANMEIKDQVSIMYGQAKRKILRSMFFVICLLIQL